MLLLDIVVWYGSVVGICCPQAGRSVNEKE